jgi:tetratricopeptide (TPR) repeat protein
VKRAGLGAALAGLLACASAPPVSPASPPFEDDDDGAAALCVAAAAPGGADATALGVTGLRLQARGQDLAGLARVAAGLAPVPKGRKEAAGPADAAQDAGILASDAGGAAGEVAGRSRCDRVAWARVAVRGERAVVLPPTEEVGAEMHRGRDELAHGHGPEARAAFAAAAAQDLRAGVDVPGPLLAVAWSYAAEKRFDEAAAVYRDLRARFAANPLVHAGLGGALMRTGARAEAVDAWAQAVALSPTDVALLRQVAADPFVEVRPAVPPPARRRDDGRWVLTARKSPVAPETAAAALAEAAAYANCKEGFRTSPALRQAVGADGPAWRWSPAEESVCTAVWLTAYARNRDAGRSEDAGLDDLLLIARQGFLDERALFDVGAPAHPLVTALLDDAARARLLAFVRAFRVVKRERGGWLL